MSRHRKVTCIRCDRYRWHRGRNLCEPCHVGAIKAGTLDDWPRLTYSNDELLNEWGFLARDGYTRRQAADRLGIDKKRLEKAIERNRRRALEGAA